MAAEALRSDLLPARALRYGVALAIVVAASLLRAAVDPLIHDQIPYFIYTAAIVVATWFCGVDGGILGTVLAAFVGNYLFVPPRYELIPHGEDWAAMGLFSAVSLGLVWLVGRWRRAERTLRHFHAQLQAATLAAEVGVWTWMPDTNRVSVGANWRGLFGVPPEAAVTLETWAGALHPDDRERAVESLKAAWQGRHEFSSEYRVVRSDGSTRWIIDRGRPIYDARGNAAGMAGINVDITDRKEAEQALQEANRLKDEFLATLSHELRTPLNAIVGWSDMLRRGTLKPTETWKATEAIYRNAKIQSELIADVLDVSRIISGKVRIDLQPMDVPASLHNAIEAVRSAAEGKGVALVAEIGSVPFPLLGDATRIQQVCWNLLSNAVKFTPPGGTVRVSLELLDTHVRVRVADTGIGIGPEFLPHVWERFRQRDSSSTRTHGGLGLGLAIARHLVELHGGSVEATSEGEGKGATFTVMLPARRCEEQRHEDRVTIGRLPAVDPVVDDASALCGIRILLVDDERDGREVAASALRHHGATVAVAADAVEALEQFEVFGPGVLLIDLAMPGMDGYELLQRIRTVAAQKGRAVPAIAFTAYAREEDRRRALANGFQLHLAKPVDSRALVRAVADVWREGCEAAQGVSEKPGAVD